MAIFTLGADPEFMLVDPEGIYRSAIGVIHGDKDDRISLGNGVYAFYDNVLAEVNIKPGNNKADCIKNFGDCFKRLAKLVGNMRVTPQASHTYDLSEMQHPDAQRFGCDPEFCIYTKVDGRIVRMEPPVVDPNSGFRTGGGHIHIGSETCLPWNGKTERVVQMLDVFVGVTALCINHDPTSPARIALYGGAGTHRVKMEYGLEYRTLSNFWTASPRLVGVIFDLVNFVLDLVESGESDKILFDAGKIRSIINSGNRKKASHEVTSYRHLMPNKLWDEISDLSQSKINFDFYKEWNLK